ncbi:jouberin [Protopterus annectens]|uniref:jouberin n=1 Tax=Protopterus annectens TaxID=7888 RepID=UPI001CF956F3|nr:jouberin [Protopterus annectens]
MVCTCEICPEALEAGQLFYPMLDITPYSLGFYSRDHSKIYCYGESEARAKTKARFEEVFKSYTDRAANNKKLKKTTSQDSIVLETFKNKFDLAKENEYETVLTGTYDPDKSPQFPKSGERDKTVGSRKINSDSHLVEGRGQRKKKNEPVEDQLKDEQFKAEYISEEMDTGQARGVDNEIFHHISGRKKQKHALKEQMSKAYEDEDEEQQLIQAYQQQVIEEAGDKVKTKSKKKTKKRLDVASNVVVQEGVLNGEVEENRVRSNAEADISRVSSSYMRQIELEDKKKKSDKNTEVFSPETEADGIDAVQKHRTVEGDQYKTKRKKVKKKAVGEESGPREVNKPISEAEDEQEQKKQVHDDSFVLGVYIHRMDRPKMDLMVSNPVVKVHVVDEVTGMYVKKENSHPVSLDEKEKGEHILPVMTQPYSFKKFKSTIPEWEELVIFNERFGYFLQESEEQPKVILFFEVLDLLCSDEAKANFDVQNQEQRFCKISWAFLKLVGANGNRNTDGKLRLQLYYPPQRKRTQLNTTEIFDWWKKYPRERSPSTLYVTVKGLKLPDQLNPLFHSTMAVHQDQGSSSHNEQQSEMANTNTNASLDGKKTDFLKWSRLPGQACRIPNKHLLSLRAGQMGCFCICFSHDGRTLAAACADKDGNPILLYEIPSGRRLREFIGHLNIVYDLCWRNDDKNFLSASSDGTVRLWKPGLHDNRSDKVLPHPSFVYAARYHPFAEYLVVTGCYDSVIRVWNVSVKDIHGQLLQEIAGHKSFINALCFDAEGLHMFSADSSGVIIVWNTFVSKSSPHHSSQKWHSDKEIIENDLKGVSVNHLEMHPNGRRLLIHAKDSILRVMDLRIIASKKFIGAVNYREKIRSTFTPCGTFLFSGSEDGTAYVWNAETGDQVAMYYDLCYSTPLRDIAFHPHEHMVAFCAFGQNQPILVYLYDHKVAQLEAEAIKDLSGTQSLSLPKGPRILTSGSDTTMLQDQSSPLFDKFASAARISTRMQKVRQKLDSVLDLTSHSVSRMELLYDRPVTSTMLDLPRESSVNNPVSIRCLHFIEHRHNKLCSHCHELRGEGVYWMSAILESPATTEFLNIEYEESLEAKKNVAVLKGT